MIIIKIQLLVFTVASLFVSSQCGSLNMEVRGHDMECLYLTKEKGDSIECFLSVSSDSGMIDFTIYKPDGDIFKEKRRLSEHIVEPTEVPVEGDYKFCFFNAYSRQKTIVAFEYDLSLELDPENEGHVKKRVKKEKKNFLIKAVNDLRLMNQANGDAKKKSYEEKQHELWDMLKNNLKNVHHEEHGDGKQDAALKNQMLLLSVYFDRIESFLEMHKSRIRRHHYLQLANNWNVMFYSIIICLSIVIAGIVQLVVLKGFVNGKMSWKVWQF